MDERFDEIYQLYTKDIYRLSYSYVLNKVDTEDITQKTFYKLYKNKKILSLPNEEVKRWLFRVCVNESKDLLKSPWKKLFNQIDDNMLEKKDKQEDDNILNYLIAIPLIIVFPYIYTIMKDTISKRLHRLSKNLNQP